MELKTVVRKLEHDSLLAIEWFEANYMKLHKDKKRENSMSPRSLSLS